VNGVTNAGPTASEWSDDAAIAAIEGLPPPGSPTLSPVSVLTAYWHHCSPSIKVNESHSEANRQRVAPPGSTVKSEAAWCAVMR
jgi:hypothetical protein